MIPGQRLHEQTATPVAVLDDAAVRHNVQVMAEWCAQHGVELAPHGKTTMTPELFRRQLAAGASAITAATPAQVRVMYAHEVRSVQMAAQLVQPREARWVAERLAADSGFTFVSWVDSAAGIAILDQAAAGTGAVFDVLLELGIPGGRTGCRTDDDCAEVLTAAQRSSNVRVIGVAGYEGTVAGDRGTASMDAVRAYLGRLRSLGERVGAGLDGPVMLSAGGSMYFDLVADELASGWGPGAARVVLRSGCYVTHDHGLYHGNSPLDEPAVSPRLIPALTVWGTVLSRPEPDRAYLDVGRRDVSFDQGFPVPLRRLPGDSLDGDAQPLAATVTALNDQHAHLQLAPETTLDVGDRVEVGISHPCTTFDKWRQLPLLDRDGVVLDVVSTHFGGGSCPTACTPTAARPR